MKAKQNHEQLMRLINPVVITEEQYLKLSGLWSD